MESLKGDDEGPASGVGMGGRGVQSQARHLPWGGVVWGDPVIYGVGILFLGAEEKGRLPAINC